MELNYFGSDVDKYVKLSYSGSDVDLHFSFGIHAGEIRQTFTKIDFIKFRESPTKATDLSGGLVLRRDIQDTVSINVESDGDLGYSSGCSRDFGELEFSEQVVVPDHGYLSFVHLDQDSGLVVGVG
ncbi:hypothetical protein ACFX2I_021148 [Malus domestica]